MSLVLIERRKVWEAGQGSWYTVLPKMWVRCYCDMSKKRDEVLVAWGRYIVIMPKDSSPEEIMEVRRFLERVKLSTQH